MLKSSYYIDHIIWSILYVKYWMNDFLCNIWHAFWHFYFAFLTLIVKFLGNELDHLPGKLIHQKIMSTYSIFFKPGSWSRPFYWKTHPIVNWRIFGHDTGRFTGMLIQKKAFSQKRYFTNSGAKSGWVFQDFTIRFDNKWLNYYQLLIWL